MLKKNNKKGVAMFIIFISIIIVLLCYSYRQENYVSHHYSDTKFVMDTVVTVDAYGSNAEKAVQEAFAEMERVQKIFDRFVPDSDLAKVNKAAGIAPVKVSSEVINVSKMSLDASKKLEGAFDITVGPLVDLWGIGKKESFVPTDKEIAVCLPLVDFSKVVIDENAETIFLPISGMSLDFGGVAKGYAVDKAADVLKKYAVKSALINAGGTVRVIGKRPDGNDWVVGVQDPRKSENIAAKITMEKWDTLETSGDYQRSFEKDGVLYSHIIDSRTGKQPRELASVTIATNNAALGDILSTAFFILGADKSLTLIKQFPGTEAVFIKPDGEIVCSEGIELK